jgi:O-6-methylguanine DNA methyltransferase
MTLNNHDPIIDALGTLSTAPPHSLVDRLMTNWLVVPGQVDDLYVAFTQRGISYIRTAASMDGADEKFLEAYRDRFGRPLRRAPRPPAGLLPALRNGTGRSVRIDLLDVTDFERDVLDATRQIPVGQTRPYRWVAAEIGRPGAVRAVGTALGRNPVPLLVPCHRVTRSTGEPGDYVFGAPIKDRLLRVEKVNLDEVHELAKRNVYYLGSDTTGIVCFPTCAHARRITEPHRRGFRSIGQAELAGYRPCKVCRPAAA